LTLANIDYSTTEIFEPPAKDEQNGLATIIDK